MEFEVVEKLDSVKFLGAEALYKVHFIVEDSEFVEAKGVGVETAYALDGVVLPDLYVLGDSGGDDFVAAAAEDHEGSVLEAGVDKAFRPPVAEPGGFGVGEDAEANAGHLAKAIRRSQALNQRRTT